MRKQANFQTDSLVCASLNCTPPSLAYTIKRNSGRWWGLRDPPGAVISSLFLLSKLSFPAMPLCWIGRILLIVIFILNLRLSKTSLWKQCSLHSAVSPGRCYMEAFNHKIWKLENWRNPTTVPGIWERFDHYRIWMYLYMRKCKKGWKDLGDRKHRDRGFSPGSNNL